MMAFDEAVGRVLALARVLGTERVALEQADGRVLAEDLVARAPLPAFDYSAMDGYALEAASLVGDGPYGVDDVERAVEVSVIGQLPDDPDAAEVLRVGGSRSRLARSQLARAVGALGGALSSVPLEPTTAVAAS